MDLAQPDPFADHRQFWSTDLVPVTLGLATATAALFLLAGLLTHVDAAIAIPVGSTAPWSILAGLGFWALLTLAADQITVEVPGMPRLSASDIPMLAAAALGGPLAAGAVLLLGCLDWRGRGLPMVVSVSNLVGSVLPCLLVTLLMEPLRPSLLQPEISPQSLAVNTISGLAFLAFNAVLATGTRAHFELRRTLDILRQRRGEYLALTGLLPLGWVAAEMYVKVGWWTGLVFAGVVAVWQFGASRDGLDRLANQDRLTGVLNRRGLEHGLQRSVGGGAKPRSVGVVYLDLDGFKPVNDSFGHDAGDTVLETVATRLSTAVRPGDLVARMGGDEFVIVLPGLIDPGQLKAVAARVAATVALPVDAGSRHLSVSASLGTAHGACRSVADVQSLVAIADSAMYSQKETRQAA